MSQSHWLSELESPAADSGQGEIARPNFGRKALMPPCCPLELFDDVWLNSAVASFFLLQCLPTRTHEVCNSPCTAVSANLRSGRGAMREDLGGDE
ncbi:hypothetical protein BAUCODRAFT_557181 [Baudoinia panamericana UAMH 10762]|uniref:Uncharacterized protein n=1 Tax=Baudoinia panamericana (strain UAMH 10762) TaxID=717646 RepID=M2LKB8_BAUPA|nr:uncharacterized protein BAUCODRAFT_557181 [Baudoinia panamericana UAMH 10762]EMC94707.1 hypothetical protein BAUCODRAFT_557181 [Baudoinia panamericana UAMH 10762]